jgi:hypothetical protein
VLAQGGQHARAADEVDWHAGQLRQAANEAADGAGAHDENSGHGRSRSVEGVVNLAG